MVGVAAAIRKAPLKAQRGLSLCECNDVGLPRGAIVKARLVLVTLRRAMHAFEECRDAEQVKDTGLHHRHLD
jgi:hypothetical protein